MSNLWGFDIGSKTDKLWTVWVKCMSDDECWGGKYIARKNEECLQWERRQWERGF